MVRAILDGTKTQTRRVVKLPHDNPLGRWEPTTFGGPDGGRTKAGETIPLQGGIWHTRTGDSLGCPYGQPGDRLWVRETCRAYELSDTDARTDRFGVIERLGLECPPYGLDGVLYSADGAFREIANTREAADAWSELHAYRGKRGATVPQIHMPRWASRITLEITGVRVERLQDISEADAKAEGAPPSHPSIDVVSREFGYADFPRSWFAQLWDQINGAGSWDANPWVWCLTFRRV